jgi:hypothetical protein
MNLLKVALASVRLSNRGGGPLIFYAYSTFHNRVKGFDIAVLLGCGHMGEFMIHSHFLQIFPKQACLKLAAVVGS